MPALFNLRTLEWDGWLYGLLAGIIGGGSAAVVNSAAIATVAPDVVMRGGFYKIVIAVFVFGALKDAFLYLTKAPLPAVKTVETVKTTELQPGLPMKKVETTTETTTIAPADPKKP